VAFEPVAMQIDDARQHQPAAQVNLGRRAGGDLAIGNRQVGIVQRAIAQQAGAGQADRGKQHCGLLGEPCG